MDPFQVRPLAKSDRNWVSRFTEDRWGSRRVVSKGKLHYPEQLEGFLAVQESEPVGLLTYRIEQAACEVVTLDSTMEGHGVGSFLMNAVKKVALSEGCGRLWLITTNDNLHALGFYQKRGFRLVAVYPNALEKSRKLKPEIPVVGRNGIPLRDEIELEMLLTV